MGKYKKVADMTPEELEKKREYHRAYRAKHLEKSRTYIREYARKTRETPEGREKSRQSQREYTKKYLDEIRKRSRDYYWNNREKCQQRNKKRYYRDRELNPGPVRKNLKRISQQTKERKERDPAFVLTLRMRARVSSALKQASARKHKSTMALVGCSGAELKAHIESLFLPGMSWDRRSEFHIDHVRPCASFDLTDPKQQMECFHYTNLRPIFARDNLLKNSVWGGKLIRRTPQLQPI